MLLATYSELVANAASKGHSKEKNKKLVKVLFLRKLALCPWNSLAYRSLLVI